jgi:hypothetical protein
MDLFPSNSQPAGKTGSTPSERIFGGSLLFGQDLFGKTVPAFPVHALTFQAFDRKPCSGLQPVVSNSHVTVPATSA